MLADAHACAEGASPTRMLGAARAQSSYTLRALLLCINPTCAFPLLSHPPPYELTVIPKEISVTATAHTRP